MIGKNFGIVIITSSLFFSLTQCFYIYKTNLYEKNKPSSINHKNIYNKPVSVHQIRRL